MTEYQSDSTPPSGSRKRSYHRLAEQPRVYSWLRSSMRGTAYRAVFASQLACIGSNDRVLDLGCGTGDMSALVAPASYVGIDKNPRCIEWAQKRYGQFGEFLCQDVVSWDLESLGRFDIVLGMGLIHHLDDDSAMHVLRRVCKILTPGGRVATIDTVYLDGDSPLVQWLKSRDRGGHVRTRIGHERIFQQVFSRVESRVCHDLLYVPVFRTPYPLLFVNALASSSH